MTCKKCWCDDCAANAMTLEAARRVQAGELLTSKFKEAVAREQNACDSRHAAKLA
jgi:hypothetical protein